MLGKQSNELHTAFRTSLPGEILGRSGQDEIGRFVSKLARSGSRNEVFDDYRMILHGFAPRNVKAITRTSISIILHNLPPTKK